MTLISRIDNFICCQFRPESYGSVLLNSTNPFTHPRVNPKYGTFSSFFLNFGYLTQLFYFFPSYISTHDDLAKFVRGMRLCHKVAQQEPISLLLDHECDRPDLDHHIHLKSDAELEEIVRERVETVYHPTSTCRMAPLDQGGVVDSKLKVYGVDGLRVCDASIFPSIVSGHTVRFLSLFFFFGDSLCDSNLACFVIEDWRLLCYGREIG